MTDTYRIHYFKAQRQTPRFNKNQQVWIHLRCANHSFIRFKYRGKGRYVNGIIGNDDSAYGPIHNADVTRAFAERIVGKEYPEWAELGWPYDGVKEL